MAQPDPRDARTRIMSLGDLDDEPTVAATDHLTEEPAFPAETDLEDVDPLEGWESPTVVRQPAAGPVTANAGAASPGYNAAAPATPGYGTAAPEGATVVRPLARNRTVGSTAAGPAPVYATEAAYAPESAGPSRQRSDGGDGRPPRGPRERKRAKHGCLSSLLWLVMLVVLGFMAIRCIPAEYANGRAVPELASFIPLMLVPALVCAVLALLWRRRVLAVVSILALAVMGWWHAGYFVPGEKVTDEARSAVSAAASTEDSAARIMTLNTRNGGASAAEIVALVRSQNVEVLCLQELTDSLVAELSAAGLDELLPYHVVSDGASAINNGGRNGIWTLAPMQNVSTNLLPIETSSMPAASILVGDTLVRVVSVHPNSPVRGAQGLWESGLSVIGSLSDYDHSYLIMGDFNSTWDHARFRELLSTSFADAGETSGEGFHMTYPSDGLPSLIEIDHIVYSVDSGIVVSDLATATVSGTDHQALLGTLEVR